MKIPQPRQLPSGSWFCRIRVGGNDICITEPSEARCRAHALAVKTGIAEARRAPTRITLRQACQDYIAARRNTRSPTTLHTYQTYVDNAFPSLMGRQIGTLKKADFIRAISEEAQRTTRRHQTVSAASILKEYAFIASVLREYDVPVPEGVNLPSVQQLPVILPEPEAVLAAIRGSDIELPCLLAAWFSLTESEIRALRKSKHIKKGRLYITETTVRVGGKDITKSGDKEEKRARVHNIPPYIQGLIDAVPGDVLCPFTPRQLYGRFQTLQKHAGVSPQISFHQMRHLNASIMAALGIQKEIARERGGWQTDAVMERVYTHTFTSARRAADASIDAYFAAIFPQSATENGNENGNDK